MKQWVQKLIQQLDISFGQQTESSATTPSDKPKIPHINEEKATLLYMIDIYNKHLFEIENHSIRKVREKLDKMAKALVENEADAKKTEDTLFEIRQFFSSYRIDEYSYIQNTFDDFKRIVWDFADQLSEDDKFENAKSQNLSVHLKDLKEAVDANSIESLRQKSREFINSYMEYQKQKNDMRTKRMTTVKKNLNSVKKQLLEAHNSMSYDHLTQAHNRKSFEDYIAKLTQFNSVDQTPLSLIMLDIDYFKKINDSFGHDIGDFVLKECVKLLQMIFSKEEMMVARLGGEEFAVILPDMSVEQAAHLADIALKKIRAEVFIQDSVKISFTVSMGIAQLMTNEKVHDWIKRADQALYHSKNTGRNQFTLASQTLLSTVKSNNVA